MYPSALTEDIDVQGLGVDVTFMDAYGGHIGWFFISCQESALSRWLTFYSHVRPMLRLGPAPVSDGVSQRTAASVLQVTGNMNRLIWAKKMNYAEMRHMMKTAFMGGFALVARTRQNAF